MSMFRNIVKTGVAMKAFEIAKRELAKPENQRKAKALMAKAQAEIRKPENQQKAKALVGKVTKKVPGGKPTTPSITEAGAPRTLPPAG
ncbi:MAG: hypothetical protein H0T85_08315 [Geodermatophilaceae bacterium]|nr:hypothetical protein [Geodermatophilaceae bacterium]